MTALSRGTVRLSSRFCRTHLGLWRPGLADKVEMINMMVACDPRDTDRFFKCFPRVLIEVLSDTTERTDRREKLLSYTRIDTLEEYVLVAQDRPEITVFRRGASWQPEVLRLAEQSLRLPSIDFTMPLSAIYEGVKL